MSEPTDIRPDDEIETQLREEHQAVPADTRQKVFDRDNHRCHVCGRRGQHHNGSARLVVQRIADNPVEYEPYAPANLETRCLRCARWVAQMPSLDDLPPVIAEQLDDADIQGTWSEILQVLVEIGPATTGKILAEVSMQSHVGVRQAVYSLMSLDVREDTVANQLVVRDRVNGTYGLPWQIPEERRSRGTIPTDPDQRQTRALDEIVRRLYSTLGEHFENPKPIIAEIVGREERQTWSMRRRAEAFQFPFNDWSDPTSLSDDIVLNEAVELLADASSNVSPQLLAESVAETYAEHGEDELARQLHITQTDPSAPHTGDDTDATPARTESTATERTVETQRTENQTDLTRLSPRADQ